MTSLFIKWYYVGQHGKFIAVCMRWILEISIRKDAQRQVNLSCENLQAKFKKINTYTLCLKLFNFTEILQQVEIPTFHSPHTGSNLAVLGTMYLFLWLAAGEDFSPKISQWIS